MRSKGTINSQREQNTRKSTNSISTAAITSIRHLAKRLGN